MDRLVQSGQVSKSWSSNPYHGIVSKSVVVFVLRNGNPKHISTWDDLVKPGVQVVFPNPFSSGGARWDVMAAYGAHAAASTRRRSRRRRTSRSSSSTTSRRTRARATRSNTFLSGKGDVLLDYESDAKLAQSQGKPVFYLIPQGDAPDRDAARRGQRLELRRREAVRRLAVHAGGADDLGAERLPLRRPERREEVPRAVPAAAGAVQDRLRRRLGEGRTRSSSIRRTGSSRRSSRGSVSRAGG